MLARYLVQGVIALAVVGFVASAVSPWVPEQGWATVNDSELHAEWLPEQNAVRFSLELVKHRECSRIISENVLRPVEQNNLEPSVIGLTDTLDQKLMKVPIGETVVRFDDAVPTRPVRPGHYVMQLSILCEPPAPEADPAHAASPRPLLATAPVQVPVLVRAANGQSRSSQRAS